MWCTVGNWCKRALEIIGYNGFSGTAAIAVIVFTKQEQQWN